MLPTKRGAQRKIGVWVLLMLLWRRVGTKPMLALWAAWVLKGVVRRLKKQPRPEGQRPQEGREGEF
jgi:hypothetical protein